MRWYFDGVVTISIIANLVNTMIKAYPEICFAIQSNEHIYRLLQQIPERRMFSITLQLLSISLALIILHAHL